MRPFRGAAWLCALALLAAGAHPLQAAWNNVFQVCCHGCGSVSSSSYSPYDPCCNPCPQQVCTTRYVQRCYYQPVTTYQTRTYYEPVTTYRTSYYYEPVTSYRYSYYRDPCTGCCQQVACQVTCYRLRSQCCPVTSYLQRCCLSPVTSYQQAFYYEPVTTCCTTSGASPWPAAPPCNGAPGVQDRSTAPAPGVSDRPGAPTQRYSDTMPPAPMSGLRQLAPLNPQLAVPVAPARPPGANTPGSPSPPPAVKLERIVALPDHNVEGQVVREDRAPQAHARLLFVSALGQAMQQPVTADAAGQFRVTLASGGWLVYLHGADGKPVFHTKIDVRENETRQVRLTCR